VNRPDEAFEIDQLRKVIQHLNVALARCYAILAELERPVEQQLEASEPRRVH
jgi:hypothetical protein